MIGPFANRRLWQSATLAALIVLAALLSLGRYGDTAATLANDVPFAGLHTSAADTAGYGTSPMTTPALATPDSGSLILVQVLTQSTNTLEYVRDNKGNSYRSVGGSKAYARKNAAGSYLFAAENATGGQGHTWSLGKTPGNERNEATMFVVVFPPRQIPRSIGATSYLSTIWHSGAAITTTGPHSDVVSFFGPADYSGSINDYTPPRGWTRLDQVPYSNEHNSGANAVATIPSPGTSVDPNWASSHWFWGASSLWLVEVK